MLLYAAMQREPEKHGQRLRVVCHIEHGQCATQSQCDTWNSESVLTDQKSALCSIPFLQWWKEYHSAWAALTLLSLTYLCSSLHHLHAAQCKVIMPSFAFSASVTHSLHSNNVAPQAALEAHTISTVWFRSKSCPGITNYGQLAV